MIMQSEVVLLYAVKEDKAGKIKKLMKKQNVAVKVVPMSLYGQAVGNIALGGKAAKQGRKTDSFVLGTNAMDEMMVFSGISSERMDVILAELKKEGIRIPLKAVITMFNFTWTGYELYQELQKERKG